jgi:hypothetical protein
MIDRLEKAGYVKRANDSKDRRKTHCGSCQKQEIGKEN